MKNITQEELKEILEKHSKFIRNERGGERADLLGANLRSANLSGANLSGADLSGANLSGADLSGANLRSANLSGADLSGANLSGANLRSANLRSANLSSANLWGANLRSADLSGANLWGANLRSANLWGANLRSADLRSADLLGADLRSADLSGANLRSANLRSADLSGANLEKILYDSYTAFFDMCCPEEGAFVGFKRCANNLIVKLLITEEAKRSSATTRKCRCSEAKVLEILTTKRKKAVTRKAVSIKDENFVYEVEKTVFVKDFCEDRWEECAAGIHFFLTFDEAVRYDG